MKYTPEQEKAITTTGEHISVSAGAGSGKTHVLVDRIVHLLEHDKASISEIVAITFTRKAASEMKERLREACYKKAPDDDAAAMTRWRDILYQIDTARITTIDSFCSGLLREHALWLQDDPDYALMSESDMALLPKRIAQETLVALLDKQDAVALHVATELGITQTVDMLVGLLKKPNLHETLLEYAGSDAETISQQWQECIRGFIEEEARNYLRRANVLDDVIDDPTHKYEQFRVLLVQLFSDISDQGIDGTVSALVMEISDYDFKGGRVRKTFDAERYRDLTEFCKEARESIQSLVLPYLKPESHEASAQLTRNLAVLYQQVFDAYQLHRRGHSVKDFSDLLRDALTLLDTQTSIRDQVAGSIRYLMIDEFQDTNPAQWALAQRLMKTDTQTGPELFIVGDAKQSIYRFRNADVAVFQEAQCHTTPPILLNTNFRTLPNVMDGINNYFAKSQGLKSVAHPWERLEAHRPQAEGDGRLTFLLNTVPGKSPVSYQRQSEAKRIADHIQTMCCNGSDYCVQEESHETGAVTHRPVTFGDTALLFRTKSNIYLYENALKALGIPYVILGGSQFFHRQEIADITNLFHVLLDPWNEDALFGWLRSPAIGLSDDSLVELAWQHGLARQFYSDAPLSDPDQQAALEQARVWFQDFKARADSSVSDLLHHIMMETNVEAILLGLPHGEQRLGNVQKLLDTAREMTQSGHAHLHEFVQYVEEQTSPGVLEGDAPLFGEQQNAVTLMTIHASKGLEFPVVILPDTSKNPKTGSNDHHIQSHAHHGVCVRPPATEQSPGVPAMYAYLSELGKAEERDEDARVLYVATTRARDYLIVSGTLLEKEDKKGEVFIEVAGSKSWLASFDAVFGIVDAHPGTGAGFSVLHESRTLPLQGDVDVSEIVPLEKPSFTPEDIAPLSVPDDDAVYTSTTAWLDRQFPGPEGADDDVFDPEQYRTLQRGTMVHRYLELWDFTQDIPPDAKEFLAAEYPAHAEDDSLIETLESVVGHLRASDLFTHLNKGAPLQRELPFVVPFDGQWISGTIDVLTAGGVIIDYKTGAYRKQSLPRYEAQLRLYAHALEELTGDKPSEAWIYFVDSGDAHEVGLSF